MLTDSVSLAMRHARPAPGQAPTNVMSAGKARHRLAVEYATAAISLVSSVTTLTKTNVLHAMTIQLSITRLVSANVTQVIAIHSSTAVSQTAHSTT